MKEDYGITFSCSISRLWFNRSIAFLKTVYTISVRALEKNESNKQYICLKILRLVTVISYYTKAMLFIDKQIV